MYKKIILIIICMFFIVGCSNDNINTLTLEEIVNSSIKNDGNLYNTNNKGYKYYLPNEFSVHKDNDYIQELSSHGSIYYLNVDIISYYYKNDIAGDHDYNDYEYYEFKNNDKNGYLKITKNNDNFFVELCYNYAIIEVEVKEDELRYAVSRGLSILNSIKYNDKLIENYITSNKLDTSETVYKLPEPKNKNESKNILQYIEEYEESQ